MNDHSATNHAPGIIRGVTTKPDLMAKYCPEVEWSLPELLPEAVRDDAQLIADLADDIIRGRSAGWRLRHIASVAFLYSADLDDPDRWVGDYADPAEIAEAIIFLAEKLTGGTSWPPPYAFLLIRGMAFDALDLVEPEWRDDYVCPQCTAEEAEGKADAAERWAEEAEQWAEEVEMMADAGETEGVGVHGLVGIHPGLENLAEKIGRPTSMASIIAEHWGWADPKPTLPAPLDQWGRDHLDREVRDGLDLDRYDDLRYAVQCAAEEGRPGETVEHAAEIAYLAREVMDGGPAEPRLDRIMELAVTALSWLAACEKREGLA